MNSCVTKPSVLSIALLNTIARTDVFSLSVRDCTFSHVSYGAWTRDVKSSPTHNPFDSCEWCSCHDCSDHMVCSSHQDLARASYAHAACALLRDVHTRHMLHARYKGALQPERWAPFALKVLRRKIRQEIRAVKRACTCQAKGELRESSCVNNGARCRQLVQSRCAESSNPSLALAAKMSVALPGKRRL